MTKEVAKKIAWIISLITLIFIAVLGSLLAYQHAYAGKIYRNVHVTDINLSGLTKKQAAFILQKKYQNILSQEIKLKAKEKELNIKISDTGLSFDVNQIVDDSYHIGRSNDFYGQFVGSAKTLWREESVEVSPKINQKQYDTFLNLTIPQLNIDAQDATLIIDKNKIQEKKEVTGQKVQTENLTNEIIDAINQNKNIIDLEVSTVQPTISLNDSQDAKNFAASILKKSITLSYENFAFTPSPEDLGSWISFKNEGGKISAMLDDGQIRTYLNKIAQNFEIQKVNRKINAADNSVLVEGSPGTYLDKDAALNMIKDQIEKNDSLSLALTTYIEQPKEEKVFPDEGLIPGRFEGKYIDIDLAQQKLCLVNGPNIEKCYIVSTGKWSTPTPVGTRIIDGKNARQWSGKYGLWMPWWQSLGGGYGIHELPEWPSGLKEGEAHLGTPVSHGCIRLGVVSAEEVYNWTSIGTPVYIHK